MSWIAAVSHASLVAALNADIVREAAAAEEYLRLARFFRPLRDRAMCHQIAVCAATALSNATMLAAEVLALGGVPPSALQVRDRPQSMDEHITKTQAALAHYQSRLAMARRLELLRLQEVFRDIVRSKRRHLAHAGVLASAGGEGAGLRIQ